MSLVGVSCFETIWTQMQCLDYIDFNGVRHNKSDLEFQLIFSPSMLSQIFYISLYWNLCKCNPNSLFKLSQNILPPKTGVRVRLGLGLRLVGWRFRVRVGGLGLVGRYDLICLKLAFILILSQLSIKFTMSLTNYHIYFVSNQLVRVRVLVTVMVSVRGGKV